ncbi:MAG: hypothetical protein CME32_01410 [Gimesia sp.]|nr:hypothetical protein [Gimesia sp.]
MIKHEHDTADLLIRKYRAVSSDYKLPEGGCNTFRTLLNGLHKLEEDVHHHIQKEDNIIFPRILQLAASLSDSSP